MITSDLMNFLYLKSQGNWLRFICFGFLILISEADPPYYYTCPNKTTYTSNSTYQVNLNSLLSTLSSHNITRNNLFYNATAGNSGPDRVYGLFVCRGDVTFDTCHDCVENAAIEIVKTCPNDKQARVWYDECMFRYDNESFFSTMSNWPIVYTWNPANATEPDRFAQVLANTMNELATRASSDESGNGGRLRGFATGEANFTSFQTLYNLVQCTPDLSGFDCNRCLRGAFGYLPVCCSGRLGARIYLPSCNLRYEIVPFYNSIAAPPPPPPPQSPGVLTIDAPPAPGSSRSPGGKGGISAQVIIPIVVAVVVAILLFTLGFCFLRRRAKRYNAIEETTGTDGNDISAAESLQYDLSTIGDATNNFSAENKIGEGGFGDVFKGKLSNGQEIAVKRLSKTSSQGVQEFKNEVVLVSKLQHKNLVRLVGFCLEREEKILIYEFVPNKSLDYFLFDPERHQLLDWAIRYKIIRGIALGMLYLHEDSRIRIIHRDLKASNILLDKDMNPKISDFGMAKLFDVDQSQGNTSKVVGTFGYMSPEYVMHGEFSVKSDVFSFGVLLLEIVSGKKNNSFAQSEELKDLPSHAWKLWREGTPLDLADPALRDSFVRNEVIRCINIGLLCVQEDAADRPTMASVVLMFNSVTLTLALPHQPAFFIHSRTDTMVKPLESDKSSTKSIPMSANEVSITELYPR